MRTRKILLGTLAAAVAAPLALAASPANAATALTNASFEDATVTFTDGYSVVDVEDQPSPVGAAGGEGVDIVDKALWNADEGSRSIDRTPSTRSISQTIATVPGQTYDVSFAMSGNPVRECPRGGQDNERHCSRRDNAHSPTTRRSSRTRPRT